MVVRHLAALLIALAPTPLAAQERPRALWLDLAAGAGGDAAHAAVSAWRVLLRAPLAVRVSAGLRVSGYAAMPTPYRNRGTVQGNLTPNLDIDPGVVGANLAVAGEVRFGPVVLGANLDLAGVGGGAGWRQGDLEGKPETASLFRYGTADRGALNSEFYGAFHLSSRVALRAGASHYVTNYVVTDAAAAGRPSARYQRFETVPFVALRVGW